LARKARRLAMSVSNGDRKRLFEHADELDAQATELEQRGTDHNMPPPVLQEQVQVQQQQQHETGPSADNDPKSKDD
jgi:hypothetical protein